MAFSPSERLHRPASANIPSKLRFFIQLWPMNTITTKKEVLTLLLCSIGKITPLLEWIACFPSISGLSPNMSIVHPYLVDSVLVVGVEHKAESEKYKYMLAYCFFSTNLRVISVSSKVTYMKFHLNLSILPIINRLYCRLMWHYCYKARQASA